MQQPATHCDVDVDAVPHTLIATWPVGTFLENLAFIGDDELVLSVHNRAELHRARLDGTHRVFAKMPAPPESPRSRSPRAGLLDGG